MVYYGIFEYNNREFNCIYAPYGSEHEAWMGVDRLKEAEKKLIRESNGMRRVPVAWVVKKINAPV